MRAVTGHGATPSARHLLARLNAPLAGISLCHAGNNTQAVSGLCPRLHLPPTTMTPTTQRKPAATRRPSRPLRPLTGIRVLSLALNLPGPAALMRLKAMGASCAKAEPPAGDPMLGYSPQAYTDMHQGIRRVTLDLKTPAGQRGLHRRLARTDVLLTSFRPSALRKLGLEWAALHARHPRLNLVTIVGAPGPAADLPGHDLTYMAENDLVQGLTLPATLYADMGGALATSEAVLQVLLMRHGASDPPNAGATLEVALSEAAHWLGQPRQWGLTLPHSDIGGAHAGYQVYACQDGRVAVAALEPHFAQRLCQAAGLPPDSAQGMRSPEVHAQLRGFFQQHSCLELENLSHSRDIPLHALRGHRHS